jgi:hypothetical protein
MVVGKDGVPLLVRVPPELKEKLTADARANGRSRNSECVVRLAGVGASPGRKQKRK